MMGLCIGDIRRGPAISPPGYIASFADGEGQFQHVFGTDRGVVVVSLTRRGNSVEYFDDMPLQNVEDTLCCKIPYASKTEARWRAYNVLKLAAKQMRFDLMNDAIRSVSSERGHTSR